ncbi:hypothetical protein ANCCAN_19603 [Ancylostoma caninum]|uniref:Uncharacterized protein n=1 Tax=Ancylostoma caninum TaxID=29170 RepID=A0A368FQQ7_ANCCA|nr:hypothetical protein ANCCAN_19603 [Ancylostoma caninum]
MGVEQLHGSLEQSDKVRIQSLVKQIKAKEKELGLARED